MRIFCNFILIIVFFLSCNSDVDVLIAEVPPLTDVLTLELSFGDEKTITKDEFLLARPRGICVNEDGDIFVVDENKVKVFDMNGKEKRIIGGPGEGPGEFELAHAPTVNPYGYLTVLDINGFNLFSPDYSFLKKVNFRNNPKYSQLTDKYGWSSILPDKVYSFTESERLIGLTTFEEVKSNPPHDGRICGLIYENPDTIIVVAHYPIIQGFSIPRKGGSSVIMYQGDFEWAFLPDNRVIYTHSTSDRKNDKSHREHILHIFSLETLEKSSISYHYRQIEIPESEIKKNLEAQYYPEQKSFAKKYLDKTKYYPSLQRMVADRNFLFIFAYHQNEKEEYLVDILDINTGQHISSAYFPVITHLIKDGYAYKIKSGRDIFPEIEKYKIHPAVYGK